MMSNVLYLTVPWAILDATFEITPARFANLAEAVANSPEPIAAAWRLSPLCTSIFIVSPFLFMVSPFLHHTPCSIADAPSGH
jgi:hypothetical protein